MIKIKYSSVDGYLQRKSFKSLKGARKYAQERIGTYPEMGSTYAVSGDGIGKIEVIEGVTLRQLFGNYEDELKPDAMSREEQYMDFESQMEPDE